MKRLALSLKQPWAALLVAGVKTVEVRRWATAHRGPLLIHAAGVDDPRPEGWALVTDALRPLAQLRRGVIGEAELVEVRPYRDAATFTADSPQHRNAPEWWEAGLHGFVFRSARAVPFVGGPGFVRVFEIDWEDAPPAGVLGRLDRLKRGGA